MNTCTDAFRHIYFIYINAQDFGPGKTETLASMHETCNGETQDTDEAMDHHNNAVGLNLFNQNSNLSQDALIDEICNVMTTDAVVYLEDCEYGVDFPCNIDGRRLVHNCKGYN